jgi:hypothetical protein
MNQNSDPNFAPAIARLRRKLEILKMDLKSSNNQKYHDVNECLSLVDIIERTKDHGTPSAQ